MKRMVTQAILLASLVGGSILVAAPANAWVLQNLASDAPGKTPLCIGPRAGTITHGTDIVTWTCDPVVNQDWEEEVFSGSYEQLWDKATPAFHEGVDNGAQCMALYNNGNISDGNKLIIWDCFANTFDQGWSWKFETNTLGHNCYSLHNEKANADGHDRVASLNGNLNKSANVVLEDYVAGKTDQTWCVLSDN